MSNFYYLSEKEFSAIKPYFPKSRGISRVDDRRVISGIIHVLKRGLQWRDAPKEYGPYKTLYNRFIRWSSKGVFHNIFTQLSQEQETYESLQIDSTCLKAHRTASSLLKKGDVPRDIGRTRGGLNTKLHAVCDEKARPIILYISKGQMSDYRGARIIAKHLPPATNLLADAGYDADWFREVLSEKGINSCIKPRKNRKKKVSFDRKLYKQRHKIENMFARIKDWRRIATRYDRQAHTFLSAICIAAIVCYWI
jgi:transposase